ncbi:MAG: hypothetical protein AB7G80_04780 [Dongiaceae bacterium]
MAYKYRNYRQAKAKAASIDGRWLVILAAMAVLFLAFPAKAGALSNQGNPNFCNGYENRLVETAGAWVADPVNPASGLGSQQMVATCYYKDGRVENRRYIKFNVTGNSFGSYGNATTRSAQGIVSRSLQNPQSAYYNNRTGRNALQETMRANSGRPTAQPAQ